MTTINKSELLTKYGISLEKGTYTIENIDGVYKINTLKDDTSGCVLLGTSILDDRLLHSKVAVYKLLQVLTPAFKKEPITIQIINPIAEIIVEQPIEQPKEVIVEEVKLQEIVVPVILPEVKKNKFTVSTLNKFIQWLLNLISRNS